MNAPHTPTFDFDAWDARVRDRANLLWEQAGKPEVSAEFYLDEARELLAIEEVPLPGVHPGEAAEPMIEEASIQGNLGEFPTLRDQGDEATFPDPALIDDEPRLSDGDASEEGGVLPLEELPDEDLPQVSQADADITSSSASAWDDPENPDLNDDGLPDPEPIDPDLAEEEAPYSAGSRA